MRTRDTSPAPPGADPSPASRRRRAALALLAGALLLPLTPLLLPVSSLLAQGGAAPILLQGPEGAAAEIPVVAHRGYPAVALPELGRIGWVARGDGAPPGMALPGRVEVDLLEGNPFLRWEGRVLQLADPPYRLGEVWHLPVQFVVDLLPEELPGAYSLEGDALRVLDLSLWRVDGSPLPPPPPPLPAEAPAVPPPAGLRVVVIDPGHGGDEPGAVGPGGTREKDIALGIALSLAEELKGDPAFEVYLTRDRDVTVPLWERGEMATRWKGDRHGIFVSIHANSVPDRRAVRGFETFFLAEARTEHARRVAALENAPMQRPGAPDPVAADPLLAGILNDLRNLDHQHWSALLAEFIQQELAPIHPGPNRGVKQGPFAVLTNALMPSVLVEIGFISHPQEERLMARADFQVESARSLAEAIRRFFQRYPPGGGILAGDGP